MSKALIWGSRSAIGISLMNVLLESKWDVYCVGRKASDNTSVVSIRVTDAFDEDSVVTGLSKSGMETKTIDLWVYCIGRIVYGKIHDLSVDDWEDMFRANLAGAFLAVKSSMPFMAENAHIFFLGARTEQLNLPGMSAYTASKAGLEVLAEVVRKETKYRVSVVRPRAVITDFWKNVPFKLPSGAVTTRELAERILNEYGSGHSGNIDL